MGRCCQNSAGAETGAVHLVGPDGHPVRRVHVPLEFFADGVPSALGLLVAFAVYFLIGVVVRPMYAVLRHATSDSLYLVALTHTVFNRTSNNDGLAAGILDGEMRGLTGLIAVIMLTVSIRVLYRRRMTREFVRRLISQTWAWHWHLGDRRDDECRDRAPDAGGGRVCRQPDQRATAAEPTSTRYVDPPMARSESEVSTSSSGRLRGADSPHETVSWLSSLTDTCGSRFRLDESAAHRPIGPRPARPRARCSPACGDSRPTSAVTAGAHSLPTLGQGLETRAGSGM